MDHSDFSQQWNKLLSDQMTTKINELLGVTETTASQQGTTLTLDHLHAAMKLLQRPDPRPYGIDTVYIINAHSWSLLMNVDGIKRGDFIIRNRIKIEDVWVAVPTGEVLMAHRDAMFALTGGEPYWALHNTMREAGRALTDGLIDTDEYMRRYDKAHEDYDVATN